jgi:hypothetical protein
VRGAHLPLFLNMRVNCLRHLSLFLVNHLFKLDFSSTCQGMLHSIEYWKMIQSNCKYITIKFSCCHSSKPFIYWCFCYHLWICTPIALPWSVLEKNNNHLQYLFCSGCYQHCSGETEGLQPSRLCVMVSSSSRIYSGPLHSEDELNWCCGYFVGIPLVCRLRSLASCCFSTDPRCWVPGGVCQGHKDD